MTNQFIRTQYLYGDSYRDGLKNKKIIIFGLGGVGGICAEYLVRAGIYSITLVDFDTINVSNINRQIIASYSNIGRLKVEAFKERLLDINPDLDIEIRNERLLPTEESINSFRLDEYAYVIDCIDDVKSKVYLSQYCYNNHINNICRLGAGNKKDLRNFKVEDIYDTKYCRLARAMRKELRKIGVKKLKVVYSDEDMEIEDRSKLGTSPFVPTACGLLVGQEVFTDLLKE